MRWAAGEVGEQNGRVVVVTGANSGVGFETTRVLVRHGAHVVLACRDVAKGERARERLAPPGRPAIGSAEVMALDLADLDSVADFAAALRTSRPAVHGLVNNAAVMGGPPQRSAQGLERQMATNHLGHFALTARLWPLLLAGAGAGAGAGGAGAGARARVVAVSSIAARGGTLGADLTVADLADPQPYREQVVYANTKQANLLFVAELARRAAAVGAPVDVLAAHPGVTWTNLFLRQLEEQGRRWLLPGARVFGPLVLQPARTGALPILRALTDPGLPDGGFVGPRGPGQLRGAPVLVDRYPTGSDERTAALLWEHSERLTGLPFRLDAAPA